MSCVTNQSTICKAFDTSLERRDQAITLVSIDLVLARIVGKRTAYVFFKFCVGLFKEEWWGLFLKVAVLDSMGECHPSPWGHLC